MVCCALDMVVGDNSGVHDIAGYYKAFRNTQRVCRLCYATTDDIQTSFFRSDFQSRTQEKYDTEVGILEAENHHPATQKMHGLHQRCALNKLQTFHCVTGMPLDVSHDIFEDGVARHAIELVMAEFIASKVVNINVINDLIKTFEFHKTDRNKPQPFANRGAKVSVNQTCSEMWTLLRL